MTEGTGPGRGVPWWRQILAVTLTRHRGSQGAEPSGSQAREGRTVRKIKGRDSW